jgi:hypothetical protein
MASAQGLPGTSAFGRDRWRQCWAHDRDHRLGKKMEREKGFEPSTLSLATRCSTTELFPLAGELLYPVF